jgi:hypothetical protein
VTAAAPTAPAASKERLGVFPIAGIFIRARLRSMRNAYRVRGRARAMLVATIIGLFTALAYVMLFAQAFATITRTVDLSGQLATLALVTGTIAFGSLAARAASNEAVRAGSPENEFMLARPVSLPTLVAARGICDAVTDPVGGLFLLPVLIAATIVWGLGAVAWPLAAAISLLMQIGISTLAYAVQLAIVRYIPGRRRRIAWTGLRLVAALSLATLWMLGSWVMRAPAALAKHVAGLAPVLAFSPSMLVGAPFAALVRGQTGQAALAVGALAGAVAAAMLVTVAIARRAGMNGWEEAGAVWAEAARAPAASARLPTAATKDLRLIVRDRSQLLALVAMPVIFIGVQVFGAAGWEWATASLERVSKFAYSLALYMGTIGPLTHMQAERRAFWILRTVPVPLGRLLAAKARAWAIIVGGIAALSFAVLVVSVPHASVAEKLAAGLLVTVGAAGMAFLAVAMASGGADLSDETRSAVGPTTIYAYMAVGFLFNLVLVEDFPTRLAGLVLYAVAGWTYWQAGVEQAAFCLDAEVVRVRRLRAADGATMVILYALGGRGLQMLPELAGRGAQGIAGVMTLVLVATLALTAVIYLARRPRARTAMRPLLSLLVGVAAGGCAAGFAVAARPHAPPTSAAEALVAAIVVALLVGAEEVIFRGILQRGLQEHAIARGTGTWKARVMAAGVTCLVGIVTARLAQFSPEAGSLVSVVAIQGVAAGVYALTGRLSATWLARAVVVGVAAFV